MTELKEKIKIIRQSFCQKREKASDLDVIVAEVMQLPYGQLKKVLTPQVLAVLEKYGCGEGAL